MNADIVNLIGSVGFPIAACIYMAVTQTKTVDKLRESVDNNTRIMERLLDKINGSE